MTTTTSRKVRDCAQHIHDMLADLGSTAQIYYQAPVGGSRSNAAEKMRAPFPESVALEALQLLEDARFIVMETVTEESPSQAGSVKRSVRVQLA